MKEIIINGIQSGDFELVDMLHKIKILWIEGDISEADKDELIKMAQDAANPNNSLPSVESRIAALEKRVATLEGADKPHVDVAEWRQPQGAHDAYQKGDRVTYKGKTYESTIDNNVWSPDVTGWKAVA